MSCTDVPCHPGAPPWGAGDDEPTRQFWFFDPDTPAWPIIDPDEQVLVAAARQALCQTRPPTIAVLKDVLVGLYRLL